MRLRPLPQGEAMPRLIWERVSWWNREVYLREANVSQQPVGDGLCAMLPCFPFEADSVGMQGSLTSAANSDQVIKCVGAASVYRNNVMSNEAILKETDRASPVTSLCLLVQFGVDDRLARAKDLKRFNLSSQEHDTARIFWPVVWRKHATCHQAVYSCPRLAKVLCRLKETDVLCISH